MRILQRVLAAGPPLIRRSNKRFRFSTIMSSIKSPWNLFILLVASFVLAGCGAGKAPSALESEVNGYQCTQCRFKFYTDSNIWPGICPSCKAGSPMRVAGFVCSKDNHMTIPGLGDKPACGKCGERIDAVKAPNAAELQAWGAVKKTQEEVTAK